MSNKALKYFKGDSLAADQWKRKYALKDELGNILEESPLDMHNRMADEFYRIELNYPNPMSRKEIFELLDKFKYVIPAGSQMSGIGNKLTRTSLSNCFVVESAPDSYGGIMMIDQEQVQIMKRRGGVGHDISTLRPSGALANNSVLGGLAGSVLYMDRFSNSTREVSQDGRRGALMLSMSVHHPDIDKFIDAKMEEGRVTGANISVKISDKFMQSVKNGMDFIQAFPTSRKVGEPHTYDMKCYELLKDQEGYLKKIKSEDIWNKIIHNAWRSAEPGVLFWDRILSESPAGCYGEDWTEVSTNPCGEIPLCPYDSCRLTAINLYSYVDQPFTKYAEFNYTKFRKHVRMAQRLMDDLIDLEVEKIDQIIEKIKKDVEKLEVKAVELKLWEKIRDKAIEGRRTGLGITAEGDMLAALGIPYGSEQGNLFAQFVHQVMAVESYKESINLAKDRGAFPIWDYKKEEMNPFINRLIDTEDFGYETISDYQKYGRRNIANLTIAPTGTVSLMTQTTSGIEPLFMPFYKRRTKTENSDKAVFTDEQGDMWVEYFVLHPKFKIWFEVNRVELVKKLWITNKDIAIEDLKEGDLKTLFELSPYFGSTANEIDWKSAVEMQGMVQKWIDHSISKTINLPADTTEATVAELYMTAYEAGCKGVTVYRDGCRSGVLMANDQKKEQKFEYNDAPKRPQELDCDIYYTSVAGQKYMTVVGLLNNKPYELFAIEPLGNIKFPEIIRKGKIIKDGSRRYRLVGNTGDKQYQINSIVWRMTTDERTDTRKYSLMLRHGINPQFISEQIREYANITSFDKMVQRVLDNYVQGYKSKESCPECGEKLVFQEGCLKCNCGYSKCG